MWVCGKGRAVRLGLLLFVWWHLTGISAFHRPGEEVAPFDGPAAESFRQGISAYKDGRYEEAIVHLERSLRTPTEWQEYPYFYLLKSHWEAEHVAEALGFCKAFQHHFPESPLLDRVAYIEAEGYRKSCAYWLASRAYESYLKKRDFAGVRLQYGEVLEQLERFPEAYANYQHIREKWPRSPEDSIAKFRARKIVKEHPEAIESIPRADYLREEARLCLRERAYTEALSFYAELQGLPLSREERETVFSKRIFALTGRGNLDEARKLLRSFQKECPRSGKIPASMLVVGRGYWRRNRNREAFPVLKRLLEEYTDSEEAGRAGFILGRIHFEERRWKKAIRQYRETRFLFPDTRWEEQAAWGEAWCYYLMGRYDACAEHLRECLGDHVWDAGIPRALYWQARCLEKAGRVPEARPIYGRVRDEHPESYYSVLAEWRLTGEPLEEVIAPGGAAEPGEADATDGPTVFEKLDDPAVPLLIDVGLAKDAVARLDWLRVGTKRANMTPEDWVEAYCVAGDILKGLRTAWRLGLLPALLPEGISGRDPGARRFLRLLYPSPDRYDIEGKARRKGLDPFLVAGLIHQESVFMPDAASPAGAIGLMQIMPATGRRVAEKMGMDGFSVESLRDPDMNVTIGTAYLAGLAYRYEGDWPKVFAAYNAGPGAVARWSARMPFAETDEFVEGILYRETRIYVKKVIYNWSLYHRLYGRVSGLEASHIE